MQSVADLFACRRAEAEGRIRLTVPDSVDTMLLPLLQQFRRDWPNIQVQILTSYRRLDLARGEADMAIRVGDLPETDSLLARPLPMIGWTVYAARRSAGQSTLPASPAALSDYPLVGGEGNVAALPAFLWLERAAPDADIVLRCNSLSGVRSAVRAGIGLSALPCLLGEPDLIACFPPIEELTVPLWLVTRRELRRQPHVQALFEALASHMHGQAARLCGAE
jgi:DNA-binding transcriptional LysR family regulator